MIVKSEFVQPRPYDPIGEGGRDGLGPPGWMWERSLRPVQSGGLGHREHATKLKVPCGRERRMGQGNNYSLNFCMLIIRSNLAWT